VTHTPKKKLKAANLKVNIQKEKEKVEFEKGTKSIKSGQNSTPSPKGTHNKN
jgi:hypothetical protein